MKNAKLKHTALCCVVALPLLSVAPNMGADTMLKNKAYNQTYNNYDVPKDPTKPLPENYVVWDKGYISATSLNVRNKPSVKSKIVGTLKFNKKIKYKKYNKKWSYITYKGKRSYIYTKYISNKKQKINKNYIDYSAPVTSGFKSYMPYTAITSYSSPQYKLQQKAYTGTYGIRQVNGRYCVAIGTGFSSKVGTYFDLILSNGTVIPCIIADVKANQHTDSQNMITVANGCLTEFIVDFGALNSKAKQMGDISYCNDNWKSRVQTVRIYKENILK